MPSWYTYRKEAERAAGPGGRVEFRRGKGWRIVRGGGPPPPDPLLTQATSSVEAIIGPLIADMERRQREAEAHELRQQQALQQYWQGVSGMAQGIAPAIQGAYTEGAQNTAAFGKGYSDGMQMLQQQNAGEANTLLAQNNAPAGQQIQAGPEAANVLYGLGGEIPATALQREGSAFTAAAAQLPVTAMTYGAQELRDLLDEQAEREGSSQDIGNQLRKIEAERPGLVQEALAELRELQLAERNQRLKEQAYEFETGLKVADFERKSRNDQFNQGATRVRLQNERVRIQMDRLQRDRSWNAQLAGLGISESNLKLRAAELELKRRNQGKKGGFTRKELIDLRKTAVDSARDAWLGFKDDEGKWASPPRRNYQKVVRELLSYGIPLTVAQQALNTFYRKPGQFGRPRLSYQQRQAAKRRKG